MKSIAWAALAGVLLSGCAATQYGSVGLTGGHFETLLPGPLLKVSFSANAHSQSATVQTFALYRCAELARKQGKSHFVIYESLRLAALDVPADMPLVGSMGNKPMASAFMRLLDEPIPGSLRTEDVLATHGPTVKGEPNPTAAR